MVKVKKYAVGIEKFESRRVEGGETKRVASEAIVE